MLTVVAVGLGTLYQRVRAERRAAEAVAAAGGSVTYDWQIRPPGADPTTKLTPPGPAWLRQRLGPHWFDPIAGVRLNEFRNPIAENDFAIIAPRLQRLPGLKSLSFWAPECSLADYRTIGRLTRLETLSLRTESVTSIECVAELHGLTSLASLDIDGARISAAAIRKLAALPRLRELNITCDGYDPQTGAPLVEHYLTDDAAEAIASLHTLRSVMLFDTAITDEGIEALCRLPNLETLTVSSPHVTSAVFEHVARLEHLKHLGAWAWRVEGADLKRLADMPSLVNLDLLTNLADEDVAHLSGFDDLRFLRLRGEAVTDASVPLFCGMRCLERLNLASTGVRKNGEAAKLLKQALPNCVILLPKTKREREMKEAFLRWKWGN